MAAGKRLLKRDINPKQRKFLQAYVLTGKGKASAIEAGYSAHSADVTASKLLADPKIKAELARMKGKLQSRFELKADRILEQLARMAFVDPRAFVDEDGAPIPLHELGDDAAAALQGFETAELGGKVISTKYKLVDRNAAIDKAMRHLGLFEQDNKQGASAIGQLMAEIHGAGSRLPLKP